MAANRTMRTFAYLWALPNTLLGLALLPLALLPGGRVCRVTGVLEVWGPPVAGFLRLATPLVAGGAAAVTLGHVVLARDDFVRQATRVHERAHVRQYEVWGPLFLPAYGCASLFCLCTGRRPYYDNPFERAARRAEREATQI